MDRGVRQPGHLTAAFFELSPDHVVLPSFGEFFDVFCVPMARMLARVGAMPCGERHCLPSMQLWGYSAIGDLTDSVQEPPRFLRKKF
jgi:hypothetical protein